MLTNSPAVQSAGARTLFLLSAAATVAILLWIHHMRAVGALSGLTPIFFVLFAYEDNGATVVALLILLGAALIPATSRLRGVFRWAGEHPLPICFASFVVLCLGALFIYHNHPLCMDEYAAYFQSRIFATGHLVGQFPKAQMDWLIPKGFQDFFISVSPASGEVASAYWPAHALIMTPFTALGIPWACNPALSALTLLVIFRLALHLFKDTEAAGCALLLAAASPVLFGLGISYYSMPAHLLANCLYALLLIRPTASRAFLAGIVGAIALSLHNPVPHLLFAIPWVVWIATREHRVKLLACLCAGYLPLGAFLGVGWFELTNHLRAAGSMAPAANFDAVSRLKVLLAVFQPPTPTVLLARAIGVAKVWIWAVPGLLVLACYGAFRERRNTFCLLFSASALLTLIGYVFVPPDQGHGWGYRYFHSAWMALPLLATAAVFHTPGSAGEPRAAGRFDNLETRGLLATCVVLTLVFGIGFRAWEMQNFMSNDLAQLPHYSGSEPRVVIVDPSFSFYGGDLVQNDPFLRGAEIRMITHGAAADQQMMAQQYPGFHKVFADRYGSVWSAAPAPPQASR